MLLICIASVLVCSAAEFSLVIPNASVSAQLGSSVVLSCSLSPPSNGRTFEVQWYKNEDSEKTVLLYKDLKVQETDRDARYRDRVSLIGELTKGDFSLQLKNLMVADEGEYVCLVQSFTWYEKGSVNLIVKALGSPVLVSSVDAGALPSQILMVNITCTSDGWYPKPTVTWRDSAGRELLNSSTHYRTDSEGLVSVTSLLLVSSSQSEWISCTVGLNQQEVRESRIVPIRSQKSGVRMQNCTNQETEGFWKKVFILTLVLSVIVVITVAVLPILSKKGLFRHCSCHKNAEAAVTSHESLLTETLPLNTTENTNQGNNLRYVAPEPTERKLPWRHRHKVSLTLDPSTAPEGLKVSDDGRSVYCEKPNSKSECKFPYVVSKEELGPGEHYWEVMVWDKTTGGRKSSWCVGVTQKPHTGNVLRALCYEESTGFYTNTDSRKIAIDNNMTKLGLHLNCKSNSLFFYNADKTAQNHLHTFHNIPQGTYFAFISPGVRDEGPIRILT